RCQSKIDYFAQASESYFATVDFPGFFGIKPSGSTHFPGIQKFALTAPSCVVLNPAGLRIELTMAQFRHDLETPGRGKHEALGTCRAPVNRADRRRHPDHRSFLGHAQAQRPHADQQKNHEQ
ncbi:MAG: hypothetical protein V3R22_04585, partial [Kiloniellales bacterium]